jgi:hypothetical protein
MINFKKGPALSLHQVNYIGAAKTNEGVVAGMVVEIDPTTKQVVKSTIGSGEVTGLYGFAINNQSSGDVIESGKIGVYALDGASVVETDQVLETINETNFPIGALVSAASGLVTKEVVGKAIGQVEGIRVIPRGSEPSVTVLGVKLFS